MGSVDIEKQQIYKVARGIACNVMSDNSNRIRHLNVYVVEELLCELAVKFLERDKWRKVRDELPEVSSKPYCIVVRSDDGRVQLEWILEGYDERVISFLLDKYIEWKPIN